MAEEQPAPEAVIDVETMSDEQFEEFKGTLGSEETKEPAPKPEKAAAKEPEKQVDDDGDHDEPEKDGQKRETVPHAQFHRERERRKAAEQASQQAQATATKAMERLQALLDAQKQPEPEEPEIPDPKTNPMGALEWLQQQFNERQKAETEHAAQQRQQNEARQQFSQVFRQVNADYTAAIKDDPSITDAHNALRRSIASELRAMGYQDDEIGEQVSRLENQHLLHVHQNRLDVGDYIKNWAATRGWVAKAPTEEPGKAAEAIAKREEVRLASQSLGKAGGAVVNTGEISPEQLLDMSDEEFDAYKKKHGSVARAFSRAA